MKKSTIGVMVLGFTGDYIPRFLEGIIRYTAGKDCNIIACQVKFPEWKYGIFNYQYNACLQYMQSKSIDAIIILSSFFISATDKEAFAAYLKPLSSKPIVSVGIELPFKNSFCLTSKCEESFRESFSHLINIHGCKKIAFLAANQTTSEEAKERFQAYKKMLSENKMEYDPELVLEGKFSLWEAKDRTREHIQNKGLNFDAIIAANDQMAFGAINTLTELGYKVPEDVKVIGFDDSDQCNKMSPTLSTVNTNIEVQGFEAARLAYEKLQKEKNPKVTYFPQRNVYRQSCGCVSMTDDKTDFITFGKKNTEHNTLIHEDKLKKFVNDSIDMANIYDLLDLIQANTVTTNFFQRFEYTLNLIDIRRFAVCLFDNPIEVKKGQLFKMPEKAELLFSIDRENQKQLINPNIFINPYKELLPANTFADDYNNYILEPVYMGEKHYGYSFYKLDFSRLGISNIFYRAISSGIGNACEYTQKQTENDQLSVESKTDELTKLLNRRGFMTTADHALKFANSMDSSGLVFFCDMDG